MFIFIWYHIWIIRSCCTDIDINRYKTKIDFQIYKGFKNWITSLMFHDKKNPFKWFLINSFTEKNTWIHFFSKPSISCSFTYQINTLTNIDKVVVRRLIDVNICVAWRSLSRKHLKKGTVFSFILTNRAVRVQKYMIHQ